MDCINLHDCTLGNSEELGISPLALKKVLPPLTFLWHWKWNFCFCIQFCLTTLHCNSSILLLGNILMRSKEHVSSKSHIIIIFLLIIQGYKTGYAYDNPDVFQDDLKANQEGPISSRAYKNLYHYPDYEGEALQRAHSTGRANTYRNRLKWLNTPVKSTGYRREQQQAQLDEDYEPAAITDLQSANDTQYMENKVQSGHVCLCNHFTLKLKKYIIPTCVGEVATIGGTVIFHLSKLWKGTFSILCNVIFLVRLQGNFDIDHSYCMLVLVQRLNVLQAKTNLQLFECLFLFFIIAQN